MMKNNACLRSRPCERRQGAARSGIGDGSPALNGSKYGPPARPLAEAAPQAPGIRDNDRAISGLLLRVRHVEALLGVQDPVKCLLAHGTWKSECC